jgi:hypothetical protein
VRPANQFGTGDGALTGSAASCVPVIGIGRLLEDFAQYASDTTGQASTSTAAPSS